MAVVGTAGHVDHGKSTLLLALTGRDPDRWEEEKRRGLTIDLGFTWATLPGGREVSFVDVPGHERFIKNMLAGIEAIDVALFVVAADEGWMPGSEEHLAVLDLLGVDRAVVALTKVDRVDADLVDLATLEVIDRLEGTCLAGSAVIPVSAVDGTGLEELIVTLDRLSPDPVDGSDPRLWVDRRFTVEGAGTVVTGTLLGGSLVTGQTLIAYPPGAHLRVRSIQSHQRTLDEVGPQRRVALNIVGAPPDMGRGAMLGLPGRWTSTSLFTARTAPARYVEHLTERGAYQVHVGSTAVGARVRLIEDGALVRLDQPVPLRYGDRFILRETGRRAVVGGGIVLDPSPPRRGHGLRRSARLAVGMTGAQAADALVGLRGSDSTVRIVAHTGHPPSTLTIGELSVATAEFDRLASQAIEIVSEFHASAPLRPGLPAATLVSRLGVTPEVVARLVEGSAGLEHDGTLVRATGRSVSLTPDEEKLWASARLTLHEAGLSAPRAAELPLGVELMHQVIRAGDLVRVADDLVYLPEEIDRIEAVIRSMPDGFTVGDLRDRLGLSRKYVVPILEWADERRLTRRRGDTRSPVTERRAPTGPGG